MATWKSRGLRGSAFEEMINRSNDYYRDEGLALIQKIPTPITPINIDKETRHITLAYFDQKSTVDYIGAVQGVPICFDAKECAQNAFSLSNIHPHQVTFMQRFAEQKGIAFILICYTQKDLFYYLPIRDLTVFWERAQAGGRKSIRFDELKSAFFFKESKTDCAVVPFLSMIAKDLEEIG